ncbi:c-type cytochrome [Pedobacter sp. Leaf194]|uniref:c-type cytochrome n=1 Tax=Pedobacter sp. Leaf194 TaxID=1736297 RepID=UPI000702B7AC|nr:c-type cytochrome [Pedobacter sp. Leaf194]KQS42088.1 cytochrome C [Pedobacter sp. Leaf194]RYD72168.1 MAG: c-type cytochrome [Sphingobacteriales bacterium]
MKTLKVLLVLFGLIILLVVAAGSYVKFALPNVGDAPKISINATPERIENGKYLANHVTVCMDCHSSRDWTKFAGPMKAEGFGAGGEVFNQQMGFPGVYYAANLTPAALKNWTDGEIFRAVTSGVNKNGKALFPVMAAHRFGKMDRADIYDIIAYIRTLQPIEKNIPESKSDFPVNFIINTMPQKPAFEQKPSTADTIKYGAYLVNAAGCVDCHSKTDKGAVVKGTEFGGGMEFVQPGGTVTTPNITFDKATGIGSWSEQAFVSRFKLYADSSYHAPAVGKNEMNSPMPWMMYAGMKNTDLKAIYTYLRSLQPIINRVEKFKPAK